jgi:hypothetical protein
MMRRTRKLATIAAVAALFVLPSGATTQAEGHAPQPVPFAATLAGTDVAFNTTPADIQARCESPFAFSVTSFRGTGHATHLGAVGFVAEHCSLDFGQGPGPYEQGVLTLTAANGDQLRATYTNGVTDPTNFPILAFTDDFTFVDGGTGRFVEASGGGVEHGLFHWFTDEFSVEMSGTIVYDASNRRHG